MLSKKNENKTFWEKLDDAPSWVFFIVPIIVLAIPMLYPLGIPFEISSYTQTAFDQLENLDAGDTVVFEFGGREMHWDMLGPTAIAISKYLLSQNVNIVYYCFEPSGISVPYLRSIYAADPESLGATYGEDYVIFGLAAGYEIGIASFASDMAGTYDVDYYGATTTSLPLMQQVNSAEDIDMVISLIGMCTSADWITRQWAEKYDVPVITITSWGCVPSITPYYPQQLTGIIPDVEGGAEIELLTGMLGAGVSYIDAKSVGGFLILAVFIAGNIVYLGKVLTRKEED
jgi:hypothetical protein